LSKHYSALYTDQDRDSDKGRDRDRDRDRDRQRGRKRGIERERAREREKRKGCGIPRYRLAERRGRARETGISEGGRERLETERQCRRESERVNKRNVLKIRVCKTDIVREKKERKGTERDRE